MLFFQSRYEFAEAEAMLPQARCAFRSKVPIRNVRQETIAVILYRADLSFLFVDPEPNAPVADHVPKLRDQRGARFFFDGWITPHQLTTSTSSSSAKPCYIPLFARSRPCFKGPNSTALSYAWPHVRRTAVDFHSTSVTILNPQ